MALLKSHLTPQGVDATYHKIAKVEISSDSSLVTIVVAIYNSETSKVLGYAPVWYEYINIPFSDFTVDPRNAFYNVLSKSNKSFLKDSNPNIPEYTNLSTEINLKEEAKLPIVTEPSLTTMDIPTASS